MTSVSIRGMSLDKAQELTMMSRFDFDSSDNAYRLLSATLLCAALKCFADRQEECSSQSVSVARYDRGAVTRSD